MNIDDTKTGKVYTAFPEGHYHRKVKYEVSENDHVNVIVETKIDFHPEIQILTNSFSYSAEFDIDSSMFEIKLFLYQRVNFPEPLNLKKYINENPEIIKEAMLHALPHASKIVYGLILNMGFKVEESIVKEQIIDCINKLKKQQLH